MPAWHNDAWEGLSKAATPLIEKKLQKSMR